MFSQRYPALNRPAVGSYSLYMTRWGAQFHSFHGLLSPMYGITVLIDVFNGRSFKWQWSWFETAVNCDITLRVPSPDHTHTIVHGQESNFILFTASNLAFCDLRSSQFFIGYFHSRRNSLIRGDLRSLIFHRGLPIIKSPDRRILQTLHDAARSAISFLSWLVVPDAQYNKPYLLLFL